MTNTVNDQPLYSSLQLTDYLLAWQGAQSPPTRKVAVSGLGTYYLPLTGGTLATGNITLTTGNFLAPAGTVNAGGASLPSFLGGFIGGLTLSRSSTTVMAVASGTCMDSTGAVPITLGSFTKSTGGTWVAGSGGNGMGTGLTVASSTWYHVFAIMNGGLADVYFDTSVTATHAPAGTTGYRRIGSFKTDASAHIILFSQNGAEFLWSVPVGDVNTTLGAVATLYDLTTPPGVKTLARIRARMSCATAFAGLINSPDEATAVPNAVLGNFTLTDSAADNAAQITTVDIRTDTSSRVRAVSTAGSTTLQIATYGWVDQF